MNREEEKKNAVVPVQRALQPVSEPNYWHRTALAYKIAFRILLIALPLVVVLFTIVCARTFTYDSVFSFFKDLTSAASFIPSDYETVTYTYEEGERTALGYRGGIATVTTGGVEIYSPDGKRLLDVPATLAAPRAVASRKYLLAYDFGDTEFFITNTYTKLYEGETEFPIYLAHVADSGRFALVTASEQHLSQVLLYDANFNLIQRFGRASATTDVCVSSNGRYVAIAGILTQGGKPQSVVEIYRVGAKESVFSLTLEQESAVRLSFTDDRHLALLTDKALRILDSDGDVRVQIDCEGSTPIGFDCNENGCVAVFEADALEMQNRVIVLDKKGNTLYDAPYEGDVLDAALAEERAFILSGERVTCIDTQSKSASDVACKAGAIGLFATDDKHVRLLYAGEVTYIIYEEL